VDGQRKALIVASDQYDHEGLRHLVAPAADAAALAGVLGDPKIGEFDVQVVRNESAHAVQGHVEELLLEARPEDVLLLHFSCHGLKSESGELFFAARDTRPNRLGSTAIAADFLQRCMRASRSRSIVLLLDCCYGGAFGQGVAVRAAGEVNVLDSFPGGKLGGGRGRAVITASNAMEYAFEGDQLADDHSQRPSVFTSALVDGLATGDADRDEDGWVSLNELYDYVFDRVRAETPHQTPGRDIEMSGELYLARSRRRRIRPLPIPADLQAALTDPNVYTRFGAVAELRSRLGSDDLPVAAGAYEALAGVARTDITYVADSAAAAIGEAALQVKERDLNFGQAVQGSDPPRRTVHLLGPPLARACTSRASHAWIRVEETPDGLGVSVDTSVAGSLHGEITLTGPTGVATVSVDVEVTPPRTHTGSSMEPEPVPPVPASAASASPPTADPTSSSPTSALDAAPPGGSVPPPDTSTTTGPVSGRTAAPPDTPRESTKLASVVSVLWALSPLLSLGFLTPVAFAYAAFRLHARGFWVITAAYTVIWLLGVMDLLDDGYLGYWWFAYMAVATVHAFSLRRRVFASRSTPD
jgi:Caspase domain